MLFVTKSLSGFITSLIPTHTHNKYATITHTSKRTPTHTYTLTITRKNSNKIPKVF